VLVEKWVWDGALGVFWTVLEECSILLYSILESSYVRATLYTGVFLSLDQILLPSTNVPL
jgi:hypothetical protein